MRKLLCCLSVLCVVAATGCTSMDVGNARVAEETQSTVDQKIKIGKTTKADVLQEYGNPSGTSGGGSSGETWTYNLQKMKTDPKNYIPLVGIFVAKNTLTNKMLTVTFNKAGVVSDYNFSSESNEISYH